MATAHTPQVKIPQANAQATPGGPEAGSIDLAIFTLDDQGVIIACSKTCEHLFDYPPDALVGSHISTLLPQLPSTELVQDDRINPRLAHLCHCAIVFQARRRDGRCFASELFINRLGIHNVAVLVRSLEVSRLSSRSAAIKPVH